MTKRNRQIIEAMWPHNGMTGYKSNFGYCNLLRGDFENLKVVEPFKPKEQKSMVKHHKKHGKKPEWNLAGSRMVTFG